MLRASWILVICAIILSLELWMASLSVLFPAGLFIAFYFGVSCSSRRGIFSGILTSVVAEVLLGRNFTNLPHFLVMAIFLIYYRKIGDRTSTFNHAMSGLFFSLLHAGYFLFLENLHIFHGWSLLSGPRAIRLFITAGLAGMLIFPVLIRLADYVADIIDVERFRVQLGRFQRP